jgi:hypothetical protein
MAASAAYAANRQRKAASKGAQAQEDASNAAIGEARQNLGPYSEFGQQAIPQLQQLNSGDYSGFLSSPDYLAARDMGQSQLDHSAAARGGLFGGGNTRDTIKFGENLATQYLGNYRNSLFNQLGVGQNAANTMTGAVTGQMNNIGNARQSSYQQQGDTNVQLAGGIGGLFSRYYGQKNGSSY